MRLRRGRKGMACPSGRATATTIHLIFFLMNITTTTITSENGLERTLDRIGIPGGVLWVFKHWQSSSMTFQSEADGGTDTAMVLTAPDAAITEDHASTIALEGCVVTNNTLGGVLVFSGYLKKSTGTIYRVTIQASNPGDGTTDLVVTLLGSPAAGSYTLHIGVVDFYPLGDCRAAAPSGIAVTLT